MCVCACVCVHMCAQSCLTLQLHGPYPAPQTLLSMRFPRQEYWSGLPFPSPGKLLDPRTEPTSLASLASLALAGGFFTTKSPGKPYVHIYTHIRKLYSRLHCPRRAVLSILLTTAMPDIQNKLNKCLLNAWKFLSLSCEKEVMFPSVPPHPPSFPSSS